MNLDQKLLADSMKSALKVEFLANSEELFLYAGAIYFAMVGGRSIDEKSKTIQERDKPVK